MAALGEVDCIVFTGGIGENSTIVRQMSCQGMEYFGLNVDDKKNTGPQQGVFDIHTDNSRVSLLVIPTNEEYEIARQTLYVINDTQVGNC